jgi:phosphoglycerate dehydrogenase-like enzyme
MSGVDRRGSSTARTEARVQAVAVLGLGEAGSRFAADLVSAGVEVRGYDPATISAPEGVDRAGDPESAV